MLINALINAIKTINTTKTIKKKQKREKENTMCAIRKNAVQ